MRIDDEQDNSHTHANTHTHTPTYLILIEALVCTAVCTVGVVANGGVAGAVEDKGRPRAAAAGLQASARKTARELNVRR
jgi:hypothetical protein